MKNQQTLEGKLKEMNLSTYNEDISYVVYSVVGDMRVLELVTPWYSIAYDVMEKLADEYSRDKCSSECVVLSKINDEMIDYRLVFKGGEEEDD